MSEVQLGRAIIDAVNASRLAYVWRNQSGRVQVKGAWMSLGPVGSPDIVGFMLDGSGRFVGLEVKLQKGRESAEQVQWQELMGKSGTIRGVVRSVTEALDIILAARRKVA